MIAAHERDRIPAPDAGDTWSRSYDTGDPSRAQYMIGQPPHGAPLRIGTGGRGRREDSHLHDMLKSTSKT